VSPRKPEEHVAAMSYLAEVPLQDGSSFTVELAEAPAHERPVTRGGGSRVEDAVQTLDSSFEGAVDRIVPAARALVERLRDGAGDPSEVVVEFGLTVSVEAGVIVAKASGDAHFTVKLTWTH
jgi:hypothetical protein